MIDTVLDQTGNLFNRVHMAASGHCINKSLAFSIQLADCCEKSFLCDFFFFENHAEPLTLEGTGIEDLVTAAGIGRKRDQKVRFL